MRKVFMPALCCAIALTAFAGCGLGSPAQPPPITAATGEPNKTTNDAIVPDPESGNPESPVIRVASLKGPTTMGMVKLLKNREDISLSLYGTPDEIVTGIVKGEIDIANIPANLASVLWNKTGGKITVGAINTLGVLYIAETGDSVHDIADLSGKTIYSTGKGTTPEFALRYVLEQNGITDVNIEYLSEASEVSVKMSEASQTDAAALLPEPYLTAAKKKNSALRTALSLSAEWENLGSSLVTGVTVARAEWAEQYPNEWKLFLNGLNDSIEWVNANPADAAKLIADLDIVPEAVAAEALPFCSLAYISGEDMKTALSGYLNVLYGFNPDSVGGKLPDDDFYF